MQPTFYTGLTLTGTSGLGQITFGAGPVPEPSTGILLILGAAATAIFRKRKND